MQHQAATSIQTTHHAVDEFIQAMADEGLSCTDQIAADGNLHRFTPEGDKPKSNAGWYVLHLDGVSAGCFGSFKTGVKEKWCSKEVTRLSPKEKLQLKNRIREAEAKRLKERQRLIEDAKIRAGKFWERSVDASSTHPYLIKKNVKAIGVKENTGSLVIPLRDVAGVIHSLQFIRNNGTKRFLSGGAKKGYFHQIGELGETVYIAEGFATASIIHEITGDCILVAFDTGNLEPVAKAFHSKYPDKSIVFAADNDQWTEGNPGITRANEAAKSVGGKVVYPVFSNTETKPTDFNDLYILEGDEVVATQLTAFESENDTEQEAHNKNDSLPSGFFYGDGKKDGLFYQLEDGQKQWICSLLSITARTRDGHSENHGRLLEFKDQDGQQHTWAIPMEMLATDGAEYRRVLLSKGLEIAPGQSARNLLTVFIQSAKVDCLATCVSKTGWHKGVYVFPDESIGEKDERILLQTPVIENNSFTQSGTLSQWRDSVGKYCQGNSRLLFAVSAAFAAPLLEFTEDESGGFNFQDQSSTGKTTALFAAGSVYGSKDYLNRWRATSNGLEGVAALHNDALLTLDELAQVVPQEAGEVAYMLANGTGKARANRSGHSRKKVSWRLLFLSAGEISLSQHMNSSGKRTSAGQEVRMVDIPSNAAVGLGIFEDLHGFPDGDKFARVIKENSSKCYGTPIREYINQICNKPGKLPETLAAFQMDFLNEAVSSPSDGQVKRVARRFSLVAAAGELATEMGITGWRQGAASKAALKCFNDWIAARGGVGPKERRNAIAQVRHFIELHGESRFRVWGKFDSEFERPTINRAGFRRNENGEVKYYIFPETFKKEVCKGLDSKFVANVLKEENILLPDPKGRNQRSERIPDLGNKRVYVITDRILGGDDEN